MLDYHEGRADAGKAKRIRRHIEAGCPDCRQRVAWFETFMPALHRAMTETLPPVPAAALELARNIARERQPKAPTPLLVSLAQLVFDSRQVQPAYGARSVEDGETQLVYTTNYHDVDLWQERQSANVWHLMGQVLPKDGGAPITPEQVVLSAHDGRLLRAITETSEFTVSDVPAGAYEVRLRLTDQEIVLADVMVGAAGL